MKARAKIRRFTRAISPVISVLLMIAIAVAASLVAYAWIMGYFGATTTKVGKAIIIQSTVPGANGIDVYVQNVGQGPVTFDPSGSVYVNDKLQDLPADAFDKTTLNPGETATIHAGYTWSEGLKVKIVTKEGTFTESTNNYRSGGSSSNSPVADFTISSSNPYPSRSVSFTDTSVPGSAAINQWSWAFGDGATDTVQNPSHAYSAPGLKTISLTVTDNNGKTSTAAHSLTVNDYISPTASFDFAPSVPSISQMVMFTDKSTQGSGTINSWSWSFDTGASPPTSSTQNPSCSYSIAGQKTVTLIVTDSNGKTNAATQTLNVNAAPDTAPVATADSYSTNEDTALTRNAAQGVLANDNDVDGNPLNAIKVTNPSHGSVTLNADGSFAYTPTANYNGADSFAYKANDGNLDSNTVAVIFTVNPANDAPTAVANSYTLNQDSVLSVTPPGVLGNDADPDGDVLRAIWVSGPFNGLLTLDQNGSFTYTPNAGYHGSDSFNYKAYDSQVDSNTVAVTISITQLQAMSISLYSPLDNTVTMNNQPDFKFIATHPSNPTLSCTLWLKLTTSSTPTAYGTDGNTVNGAPTIIIPSTPIPNGQYQWWINCTDSTTSIISEKRTITLNLFRGDRSFSASYDGSTRYYWLDLPDHFNSSAPTPLVIFLHGYGQDRSMYRTYFPVFRQIFHQNGWMVACPESRTISGYSAWYTAPSRSDITDVINLLEQEFNVDPSHIHVMGTSMGGSGTLKYAMFNPDIIASVCPIMGVTNFTEFYYWTPDSTLQNSIRTAYGGTPSQVPLVYNDESPLGNEIRFMHTPVFLLHGSADTVVPVSNSRNLYSSLTQAGYDVKYVEVQGVGHYATTLVEGHEQEIFEWFRDHPLHTEELPDNFAIVALPDTQFYSANINGVGVQIFNNQTQWAVNNVDGMNIVFVTHLGDVVDSYNDMTQWQNAYQSISRMEDQVPWAVLPGNHDGLNVGSPGEDLSNYITYFGAANSFQLFSAGFDDYLIFHFQYDADNNVLAWANSVIAQYPNRRVIVSTHSYLDLDGSRTAIGERLWQNFVGPHADQVFLVLCGHMHGEARRSDVVNGHTVHQILSDYQSRTNGGNGWLRILSFHPTEDKIYVNTYSPYLNSYESDLSSEFAIDYDMTSSKP